MIVVIYSCKKRLHLANQLYDMLESISNYVVIAYGDPSSTEMFRLEDKYIILKVGDEYEDLSSKTKKLIQAVCWLFPGQSMLKCDDDIIPCIPDLKHKLTLLEPHHYAGLVQRILKPQISSHHKGKTKDKRYDSLQLTVPKCTYAAGPMYYLSSIAIKHLDQRLIHYNFYEDVFVGFNLNQVGVTPFHINLYTDTFSVPSSVCYHNSKKKIYCKLQGCLGDQLFQVASCVGLATKHQRVLILVAEHTNPYLQSTFRHFNAIREANLPVNIDLFTEELSSNDVLVNTCIRDTEHFKTCDMREVFMQAELTEKVLRKYPLAKSSVFVDRGVDYSTHASTHHYVVTDDAAYQNFTIVDDSPLNTLYLMTLCNDVIGSGSSLSWWGQFLNESSKN